MSAESPRHARSGGPLTVPSQPPSDRSIIDAVSGFINDVTLSSSSTVDPKDVIQWASNKKNLFKVKSIKFKNPILDVLANKRSVVVSFSERFAVFDAATLEDRLAITTCYPCPCPLGGNSPINPLTLGDRWLAYADKKLNPSKRSSGGCESEGVTSYTATVLHAAKSLSKGLRGLGESVAHSLAGGRSTSQSPSPPHADIQQPGVVTVLDIEGNEDEDSQDCEDPCDPIVAHFIAHSEAIIALKFDPSGMLLVTADRRGHDFHVFRINPHPCGPSLASVHHLYILHRGDTTAKVQDIAISGDSRWTAISTLRGTTHVFAISPYGGACGVRTHTQPRVVNRLSRFHRSAGLPIHGTPCAHSPVCEGMGAGAWFPNPRLPPYPQPNNSTPLAQLRPTHNLATHTITRTSSGRQRLSSLSEDNGSVPLLARACFGVNGITGRAASVPLYLMAASGALLHLALHPRPARSVAKEKICDESPIELEVEAMAQWPLQRPPAAADLLAPLPPSNPLLQPLSCRRCADMCMSEEERWLSQVEIVTHAGPHRRLWMGPQFVFKTYNSTGSNSSLSEAEAVEVDTSAARGAARSNPVNMPGVRPIVPVLIDSGSASSLEHSPSDSFRRKSLLAESGRAPSVCDVQLKEDLAEAMKEDHGLRKGLEEVCETREARPAGGGVVRAVAPTGTVVAPLTQQQPPPLDPDVYTRSNDDEGAFRPVVRASAPLAPHIATQPLPHSTTIPVQSVSPRELSPEDEPLPLNTDVVIPAELTGVRSWLPPNVDRVVYDTEVFEEQIDTYDFDDDKFLPTPERSNRETMADVVKVDRSNLDAKDIVVNRDLERESAKHDRVRESVSVSETEREDKSKSLPKFNRPPDDIQPVARPRVKKSPTTKSVSDRAASGVSVKSKICADDCENIVPKKQREASKVRPVTATKKEEVHKSADEKSQTTVKNLETIDVNKDLSKTEKDTSVITEITKSANKVSTEKQRDKVIKTEEQAWDLLLNEPENTPKLYKETLPKDTKVEETKVKSKKNRKVKKSEEQQSKEDDDSFIEIHAIEDKQQTLSGELVSISTPFEEMEPASSYVSKSKKQRSSKSRTPERKDETLKTAEIVAEDVPVATKNIFSENKSFTESIAATKDTIKDSKNKQEPFDSETTPFLDSKPNVSLYAKESPKSVNRKSSPKLDFRQVDKASEIADKEVYVINTTEDDFPEIQITRGNKTHKKSPLLSEKKNHDSDKGEKPIKSWSSIAAAKNVKKVEEVKTNVETIEREDVQDVASILELNKKSEMSLQDKLIELCKRTDIMVAECDAPSDLNFVEEHHSVLTDLPTLEPMDFGLDDFKLEVMRDSLLEEDSKITSPICKINIDDILSSIKDTTNKAIESSTFNLIDIEKVPDRKEKGFNVVESDKITSQEVKLDDDAKVEKDDLEKSSDDDIASPVLSADSDKEDKKNTEAANTNMSLTKQSKSKKSRRKKK
ncbi:jg12892 [Pararge aegeria aegeria]|uniref:Jg12892 protein n=1 Tax=Pararge aegeria aegeria TaxID=348720 RepID=A0A8S4RXW5_9NEOP|nr:jg12892 [Pararge aegeria aegeria]